MRPLRETRLGKFLAGRGLAHLLDEAGEVIPGVRILDKIREAVVGEANLSDEDKKEFMEVYRLNLEELDKHLAGLADARARERDFIQATGHIDWFMTAFGTVVLLTFVYTVIVSAVGMIPSDMREIFIESRAAVRDIVLAIAAYYWGSSAGSRIKEMRKRLE